MPRPVARLSPATAYPYGRCRWSDQRLRQYGFVVTYPHGLALKFRFREQAGARIKQALTLAGDDEQQHHLRRDALALSRGSERVAGRRSHVSRAYISCVGAPGRIDPWVVARTRERLAYVQRTKQRDSVDAAYLHVLQRRAELAHASDGLLELNARRATRRRLVVARAVVGPRSRTRSGR